jgi:hypothetical protein
MAVVLVNICSAKGEIFKMGGGKVQLHALITFWSYCYGTAPVSSLDRFSFKESALVAYLMELSGIALLD